MAANDRAGQAALRAHAARPREGEGAEGRERSPTSAHGRGVCEAHRRGIRARRSARCRHDLRGVGHFALTAPHPPLRTFYGDAARRERFVRNLFDETAPWYDTAVAFLSLGSGRWYR